MRAPRYTNLTAKVGDADGGGATEVVLSGELDLEDADALDAALVELQRGTATLVLDLREVTFIDSSGARALWAAHVRAGEAGGALRVIVGPGAVRRALAVTGLDHELNLVEDAAPENATG
ncbi:MAG: anti-sigma factor antagonist [Miltoncostaeaceae bacterium]|nr:anti-sigma factor antagonist [Miltoncostaeaceae bacterium]